MLFWKGQRKGSPPPPICKASWLELQAPERRITVQGRETELSLVVSDVLHELLHFLAEIPRLIFLKAIVPSELICILNTNVYRTKSIKQRNLI